MEESIRVGRDVKGWCDKAACHISNFVEQIAAAKGEGLLALVEGERIPMLARRGCQQEEERYERTQAESYWNCPFLRHCWNEGLKLPTRNNCPECSDQYWEFRQSQANHRSIHAQHEYHHNNMDRRLKNRSVHDRLGKRVVDQNWADYEEESNKEEYVWQKGQ